MKYTFYNNVEVRVIGWNEYPANPIVRIEADIPIGFIVGSKPPYRRVATCDLWVSKDELVVIDMDDPDDEANDDGTIWQGWECSCNGVNNPNGCPACRQAANKIYGELGELPF